MNPRKTLMLAGAAVFFLTLTGVVAGSAKPGGQAREKEVAQVAGERDGGIDVRTTDTRSDRLKAITRSWNTNWNKRIIEYDEILSGGPPRDGIPSIDDPVFVSPGEAAEWLEDNEPVIYFSHGGDHRAYPLQILIWHEIVNDRVGSAPVLVTFCPLCNASIVFDRRVGKEVYEFGTSGLLRNSDLIMYDRTTESLWQQLTGEAVVGDMAGGKLTFLPSMIVSFEDFRNHHPDGKVLSRDTGFQRRYGQNPYRGYDSVDQSPFLYAGELDPRLSPMERVVALTIESERGREVDVAYPYTVLREEKVLQDDPGGVPIVIFHRPGTASALDSSTIAEGRDVGSVGVFHADLNGQTLTFLKRGELYGDRETGSLWNHFGLAVEGELEGETLEPVVHANHFWFAWAAFKPETLVYGASS